MIGTELPFGLDAAVMNALDRDPARRTPTAAAFAEQLEQVISRAGDETLEAWAERSLGALRDQHRAWLAEVVSGRDTPSPSGRATNSVTALGPLAFVDELPAAAPATPMPHEQAPSRDAPDVSTHLEATSSESSSRPPRRSLVPLILGLAVVLAIGGLWMSRSPTSTVLDAGVAQLDAAPDTAVIAQAADASMAPSDAEPPVIADAPPRMTRDASIPVRVPQDAPRAPPDAPVAPPDAAIEAGIGKLIVRHHPSRTSYLDVFVDGKPIGKTPILPFKTLPAGAHVLTLVAPATGEVLHREDIVIVDGKTTTVVQPAP